MKDVTSGGKCGKDTEMSENLSSSILKPVFMPDHFLNQASPDLGRGSSCDEKRGSGILHLVSIYTIHLPPLLSGIYKELHKDCLFSWFPFDFISAGISFDLTYSIEMIYFSMVLFRIITSVGKV